MNTPEAYYVNIGIYHGSFSHSYTLTVRIDSSFGNVPMRVGVEQIDLQQLYKCFVTLSALHGTCHVSQWYPE